MIYASKLINRDFAPLMSETRQNCY